MAPFFKYLGLPGYAPLLPFDLWEQEFLAHLLKLRIVQDEILKFVRHYPHSFQLGIYDPKIIQPGTVAAVIDQLPKGDIPLIPTCRVEGVLAGRALPIYINTGKLHDRCVVYKEVR